MKSNRLVIPIVGITLILMSAVMIYANNSHEELNTVVASYNWVDQQESISEAYENADVILLGTVRSITSYKLYEVVFSRVEVEVKDAFKGEPNKTIDVIFTGGVMDNINYTDDTSQLPKENKDYFFVLQNRDEYNEYIPVGGYQGIFGVNNGDIERNRANRSRPVKIVRFNEKNQLEQEIVGENIIEELEKEDMTLTDVED